MCGLRLFVKQAIVSLTPQAAVATLNDLLQALVLGCYHLQFHVDWHGPADAVTFLCSIGASPNAMARPAVTYKTTTQVWTIWELYLDTLLDRELPRGCQAEYDVHTTVMLERLRLMERLIESGADMECKIPAGCENIQQAIEKKARSRLSCSIGRA